jgi:hypothetical protein
MLTLGYHSPPPPPLLHAIPDAYAFVENLLYARLS